MTNAQKLRSSAGVVYRRLGRSLALFILVFGAANLAAGESLSGLVKNGTTGRPLPGGEVVLMKLEQGMTPVDKVKTDSRGRFRFRNVAPGKQPMLLEVSYRGVPYYQTASPGEKNVSIVVYDTTTSRESIVVSSHAVMLRPNGSNLEVEEQYIVENQSRPPLALYVPNGTFAFPVPENAQLGEVFAWTVHTTIPTRQDTTDVAKDRKAINWPFRPGKSVVRILYAVPYASSQATLRSQSPYPATHVFLAVPHGVQVSSDGFSPVGSEQGFDVYARQSVPAEAPLAISISGEPAAPSNAANASASSQEAAISTLPGRGRKLVWIVGSAIAVLLLVGTLFFWRGSTAQANLPDSTSGKQKERQKERAAGAVPTGLEENLDRVKREFLQLKRGRQGGTISDEDYARERERAEQTLREILRD